MHKQFNHWGQKKSQVDKRPIQECNHFSTIKPYTSFIYLYERRQNINRMTRVSRGLILLSEQTELTAC